jgi:hypothetical protein
VDRRPVEPDILRPNDDDRVELRDGDGDGFQKGRRR